MNYDSNIYIGDVLSYQKLPGVWHVGVVGGDNVVLHNTPEKGEHISTFYEFSKGQPYKVEHSGANPSAVIANAQRILANPKRYDMFRRNCQHTVTEILYGVPKSPDAVGAFVLICGALLAIPLLARRS